MQRRVASLSQNGRVSWIDREEFGLEEPPSLVLYEIMSNDVSTLFAIGDAPTIAMERGSKKALSSFSGETIISADACGAFKLRHAQDHSS